MDRICQYSTIIFAGNVTVLLIVAVATDYWEYRSFQQKNLSQKLSKINTTRYIVPLDTTSYSIVHYSMSSEILDRSFKLPGNASYQQPPSTLHLWYELYNEVVTINDTLNNRTYNQTSVKRRTTEAVVLLYTQYGNLFRDCDDLDAGVRRRLQLAQIQPSRCFNFILRGRPAEDYLSRFLPAVVHLERAAFLFAVICISTSIISLTGGCHGTLCRDKRVMVGASSTALVSGVSLTFSIALFHGKCHLLHRRPFFADLEGVPLKEEFNESRIHSYGWSFVLAWICVVLCFVQSYVWLRKAQDMHSPFIKRRGKKRPLEYHFADDEAMLRSEFV